MTMKHNLRLLTLLLLTQLAANTLAQDLAAPRPAENKNNATKSSDDFFGLTKLHQIHLEMSAAEWEAMQPIERRRGTGDRPPVENSTAPDGEQRQVHEGRFPWAVSSMTIAGEVFTGVGVRYKGNASFSLSRGNLKRNLKIKLDWTEDDQRYLRVKTLNLNAGGLDPSRVRDALSYSIFRAAGIPAPRTVYAEVTLSVSGKYEKEHLGLYTVVEQVNKAFLKDRFKSGKGLLLKPEGVASVDYFGDQWDSYVSRYQPDDEPSVSQATRLIEFARLVHESDDEEFRNAIGSYLDVDGFLRYVAVNAMLVNLDSLFVMGQNYYMYLHPKTQTFIFFPWDLDLALAGWPLGGTPEKQMTLSLMHPHSGDHKLIDRLFAIDEVKAKYNRMLNELAMGCFAKARLLQDLEVLEKTTKGPLEREAAAVASRSEPGYRSPVRGFRPPDPRTFVAKRTASIESQLAGKSTGYVFTKSSRKRSFGRRQTAIHMLVQGDIDKDGALSREELVMLMAQWFDAMDKEKSGKLDKATFVAALPDALFPPGFPHARPKQVQIPERYVAEGLFAAADSDHDGIATKESLTISFGKSFASWDTTNRGKLDGRSLYNGLQKTISTEPIPGKLPVAKCAQSNNEATD